MAHRHDVAAVIGLVIGAIAIAFAPIFAKLAMEQGEVGPSAAAFWRVTLALPIFIGALLIFGRRSDSAASREPADGSTSGIPRISPWLLVLPGLLFAGDLATWHASFAFTTVANATLLANLQAVIVGLVSWLILKEPLRPLFAIGTALAVGGVALLLLAGPEAEDPARHPLIGDGLAIITAGFYAAYILSIKGLRSRYSTIVVMTAVCAFASPALLIICLVTGEAIVSDQPRTWLWLIGLALVPHTLGQGLITFALARLPAAFSAVTLLIQPVAVAWLGWLVFDESLLAWQMVAGIIVLIGIYCARRGSLPVKENTP